MMAGDTTTRALVCCSGCGTLWKVPPTIVDVEVDVHPVLDWRAPTPRPTWNADRRCPLCGSSSVDALACQFMPLNWCEVNRDPDPAGEGRLRRCLRRMVTR